MAKVVDSYHEAAVNNVKNYKSKSIFLVRLLFQNTRTSEDLFLVEILLKGERL
jgi:hypothetical protein